MAKKKKNSYAKKQGKKNLLDSITHSHNTKGDVKHTAIETAKDIVIGVIGGGLIGAAIGKPSLIVGAGVTGAGHYTGNRMISLLGIGMMAANGFQKTKSVEGLDGMNLQSIKERVLAYKDSFMEKTYLDKVMRKKQKAQEETSGFGNLQFFNYGNDVNGAYDELNGELAALDNIQRQIEESGMAHMQMTGIGMGEMGEMGDMGEMEGSDVEGLDDIGELALVEAADFNL